MVDKTTDVIIILDSDTVLMPNAVSNLAKHFGNKKLVWLPDMLELLIRNKIY